MSKPIIFNGAVPRQYQDLLTPLLFDQFSGDLVDRVDFSGVSKVLELAAGTGSLTQRLAMILPATSTLQATDLEPAMLDVAKRQVSAKNISWTVADMTAIPFADDSFDLVVCQFGLMLVPDKQKALGEIFRVLKKHGRFVFTVWADITHNPAWEITGNILQDFLEINPMLQDPGPFSMSEESTSRHLLKTAGFVSVRSTLVDKEGTAASADLAAKGFIQGLPVFAAITRKNPSFVGRIQNQVASRFSVRFGEDPISVSSQAWVFEATR